MIRPGLDRYRPGAGKMDCDRGGQHCVRAEDDLVAVFDTSGQQRHLQSVSRVADSKGMADSEEGCQALLEIFEVLLLNESSPAADIGEDSLELNLLSSEKRRVVEEWNTAHDGIMWTQKDRKSTRLNSSHRCI